MAPTCQPQRVGARGPPRQADGAAGQRRCDRSLRRRLPNAPGCCLVCGRYRPGTACRGAFACCAWREARQVHTEEVSVNGKAACALECPSNALHAVALGALATPPSDRTLAELRRESAHPQPTPLRKTDGHLTSCRRYNSGRHARLMLAALRDTSDLSAEVALGAAAIGVYVARARVSSPPQTAKRRGDRAALSGHVSTNSSGRTGQPRDCRRAFGRRAALSSRRPPGHRARS